LQQTLDSWGGDQTSTTWSRDELLIQVSSRTNHKTSVQNLHER
jgi:hypothetical protein